MNISGSVNRGCRSLHRILCLQSLVQKLYFFSRPGILSRRASGFIKDTVVPTDLRLRVTFIFSPKLFVTHAPLKWCDSKWLAGSGCQTQLFAHIQIYFIYYETGSQNWYFRQRGSVLCTYINHWLSLNKIFCQGLCCVKLV